MLAPGFTDEQIRDANPAGADYFVDGDGNEQCAFCHCLGSPCCAEAAAYYA
jgi:hypothetical protein